MFVRLCLVAAVAGCAGDDDGTGSAAYPLTGEWTECDGGSATFAFGEDGAFAFDEEPDDHVTGTYTADETSFTATAQAQDGTDVTYETTWYVTESGDQLALGPLFPDGSHDGVVGTWRKSERTEIEGEEPMSGDVLLVLRPDRTGTLTLSPFDGSAATVHEGTWGDNENADTAQQPRYAFRWPDEEDDIRIGYLFDLIDDDALGTAHFCRRPLQ
jgi:hypothetical protein